MKKLILCFLLLFSVCACTSKDKTLQKYESSSLSIGFDTLITFSAYLESEEQFIAYNNIMSEKMGYYHQLFDKYHTYEGINNLKTINDNAGKNKVIVDQELIDMLLLAKTYYTLSDTHFDITMGNLLNLWHDHREANNNTIPTDSQLKQASKYRGFDYLEINDEENSVYITNENVSLDVGAIAKGYAVDQTIRHLKAEGLNHALLNAGGNVYFIGPKPSGPWSIGLQIPDINQMQTNSLISFLVDQDMSFVTSGDYQRFYMVDDQLYHHIIDPITMMPAAYFRSVTVLCENSAIADVLSTSLFTMSYEDGLALIEKVKANENIDIKAIWVFDDTNDLPTNVEYITKDKYKIILSPGLEEMVK